MQQYHIYAEYKIIRYDAFNINRRPYHDGRTRP